MGSRDKNLSRYAGKRKTGFCHGFWNRTRPARWTRFMRERGRIRWLRICLGILWEYLLSLSLSLSLFTLQNRFYPSRRSTVKMLRESHYTPRQREWTIRYYHWNWYRGGRVPHVSMIWAFHRWLDKCGYVRFVPPLTRPFRLPFDCRAIDPIGTEFSFLFGDSSMEMNGVKETNEKIRRFVFAPRGKAREIYTNFPAFLAKQQRHHVYRTRSI